MGQFIKNPSDALSPVSSPVQYQSVCIIVMSMVPVGTKVRLQVLLRAWS